MKYVERSLGFLQTRFAIVRYPALTCPTSWIWEVMLAYVIMHNRIIESELDVLVVDLFPYKGTGPLSEVDHKVSAKLGVVLAMHESIRDGTVLDQIDLVEHLWALRV